MSPTPDNPTPPPPEDRTPPAADEGLPTTADLVLPTAVKHGKPYKSSRFFIRGMATLLPAVMTLWLLVFAYGFVRDKIAAPINWGIQATVIRFTDWPTATDDDFVDLWDDGLSTSQREMWEMKAAQFRRDHQQRQAELFRTMMAQVMRVDPDAIRIPSVRFDDTAFEATLRERRLNWMKDQPEIVMQARREALAKQWDTIAVGNWHVLDLIGLIVAVVLFYFAGAIMSNVIGRQLRDRGEKLIDRVPLIRRVYPAVKQVTDFFFGDGDQSLKFNRVVAVEYPRKGLYSVGLVTGDTMQSIENAMGEPCLTVFVPSSPTPFTGYVITVPVKDTIDLGLSIEDALKFAVSGGVLVPPSQRIHRTGANGEQRGPDPDPAVPAPQAGR